MLKIVFFLYLIYEKYYKKFKANVLTFLQLYEIIFKILF